MKKGAMFGLDCRALKKQFGKLFLASRQSEAPQGASGSCGYAKRGAMFGLDARIALAIFGALSVISGAALYSAIQEARVVSVVVSMNELEKSLESYLLDTGIDPEIDRTGTTTYIIEVRELVESTVSGWNGPYTSETPNEAGNANGFSVPNWAMSGTWASIDRALYDESDGSRTDCSVGPNCFYYIRYAGLTESEANALVEKLGDKAFTRSSNTHVLYKSMPVLAR